ncbi:uncharacterized protein LOC113366994 [Ctenocephalides felis]|uniref:uncharacterized protein LOC113366994 n=1 Tax=Ctenocephalides felis TaxID=7515 RepID=UPI000E6E5B7C|nr:uncharacterized protein LOC113366994 [Ctenocephalides felis]
MVFEQKSITTWMCLLAVSTYWWQTAHGQFHQGQVRAPVHPVVERVLQEEAKLPPHLMNPFYKSPRVRQALAKSSWFGVGEEPVYDREAEKISRKEIYNVLSHAGFVARRNFF